MRQMCLAAALLMCAAGGTARADELSDRLEALPGVTVVAELPVGGGYRFFRLTYDQPVNHFMPWKGTFAQRFTLLHRDAALPTVVYLAGYSLGQNPFLSEPALFLGGNQLAIEHRFFPPDRRPVPTDWNDLTIFQAATDQHRIIQALEPIYGASRKISTGASKGGMATVYHRRFYERDVDGSVAYVAPNDVIDFIDVYDDFLDHVGDDPACRQALRDLAREALARRDELVPMMSEALAGETFDLVGGIDKAFELVVLESELTFWQYGAQENCAFVPPVTASSEEILAFLDAVVSLFYPTDIDIDFFLPYFYQAAQQLGYPRIPQDHLEDLLIYKDGDNARAYLPPELERRHQLLPMIDIDHWVRHRGSELMFIYGGIDPYSAETFHLGPGTRDSFRYVIAGANHGANLRRLPPEQQAEAIAALRRWAGLDGAAALRAAALPALPYGIADEPRRDLRRR